MSQHCHLPLNHGRIAAVKRAAAHSELKGTQVCLGWAVLRDPGSFAHSARGVPLILAATVSEGFLWPQFVFAVLRGNPGVLPTRPALPTELLPQSLVAFDAEYLEDSRLLQIRRTWV